MKQAKPIKGFKVFNSDLTCRGFQFEVGKEYKHKGKIKICSSGFHFCIKANDCFNYYDFDPKNKVCEVEALGKTETHDEDSKVCTNHIVILRELTWHEVLEVANIGKGNTGHSNSGNWNSGDRNSGDSNSGDRNSGDRNSGNWNSGNWNSGDRNSGNWNSGNWNSGNRNSGDSNSGYRNSGAFCTDSDPVLFLFNRPSKMTVKEWEQHPACQLMYSIDTTLWVPDYAMTDEEKKANPKYETTEGYLKTIPMKEAWQNFWHNLTDENKKLFTSLENFSWKIFTEITGITK
jgi:hypothetical protein